MTLYLDTSALVKLYVQEEHSTHVKAEVERAAVVACARVAYPEGRAALARRRREGGLTERALRSAVTALDRDFAHLVVVELSDRLAREAGALAERRALRGFDAVQLVSAIELGRLTNAAPEFLAYDQRLADAAREEGLVVR